MFKILWRRIWWYLEKLRVYLICIPVIPVLGMYFKDTLTKLYTRLHFHFHFHFSLSCIGEGNGNPLQYSRLENPRDGGAWWAAVSGVAQSRTRLKRLSSSNSRLYFSPAFLVPTFCHGLIAGAAILHLWCWAWPGGLIWNDAMSVETTVC